MAHKVLLFLIVLFVSSFYYKKFYRDPSQVLPDAIASFDACKDIDYCLAIFVAPWCSECKEAMPSLEKIYSLINEGKFEIKSKKAKALMIVGQDTEEKILEYSKRIDVAKVHQDAKGAFSDALFVRRIPTIIMWQKDLSVVKRYSSRIPFRFPERDAELLLEKEFGFRKVL
jgi:thiol-disulfide isomerase/thioredoxin